MVSKQKMTSERPDEQQDPGDRIVDKLDLLASNRAQKPNSSGKTLDLMTIAGLTQWCARAIRSIGRENFETLVRVSLIAGRLNEETTQILLALVPLFDGNSDDVISAKEVVSLMLQLDSLISADAKTDSRMLPFLFMDDMDPFAGAGTPMKGAGRGMAAKQE